MSSRQIRRLQQLVLAATEGEDDLLSGTSPQSSPNVAEPRPTEGHNNTNTNDEEEDWPATMRRPDKRTTRHRARGSNIDQRHNRSSSSKDTSASPVTAHSPTRDNEQQQQGGVHARGSRRRSHSTSGGLLPAEVQDKTTEELNKKARKRLAQFNKRRQIAEEEALLEAALQERGGHRLGDNTATTATTTTAGQGVSVKEGEARSGSEEASADYLATLDLVELLCVCDPTRLNTRQERIRAFGAAAVEDIGDGAGPVRRADGNARESGASSLFGWPASRFAFRTSLLATANRYHWPPYDSLGARLELLPVPQSHHGTTTPLPNANARQSPSQPESSSPTSYSAGRRVSHGTTMTPRPDVYALNCDSATCHRAAATLAECLENANTLQELLQCLSTCHVYYLPALLRCYIAFLLVNRVDYAYELIDCALYHVGLILARFPWQGTWRERLVPWVLGSNPLLHATLQLGAVVAQRRGCPRTAWEFAKALLSFDPRDQERMLLRIDYAALSAKRWVWLIELYLGAMRVINNAESNEDAKRDNMSNVRASWEPLCAALTAPHLPSTGAASGTAQRWADNVWVARRIALLPGFAFAAALAKHCIELEEARVESGPHRDPNASGEESGRAGPMPASPVMPGASGQSHTNKKTSRVLREMTPAQRRFLHEQVPSAATMMAGAMLRFPHAACALVQSLQGIESVCSRCNNTTLDTRAWHAIEAAARRMTDHATLLSMKFRLQLDEAFVKSQGELWKPLQMLQLIANTVGVDQSLSSPLAQHPSFATLGFDLDAERTLSRATALTATEDEAGRRLYETLSTLRFYGGDASVRARLVAEAGNDLIVATAASMQVKGKGSDIWHAIAPSVVATQTMIGIVVALEEMSRVGQNGNAAVIPEDDDAMREAEPQFRFVEDPMQFGDDMDFFFGTPPPSNHAGHDSDEEWEELETLPPD